MKRILILLLILLAFSAMSYAKRTDIRHYGSFSGGLSLRLGAGTSIMDIDHRLFIDGSSSNYLLIDGANHYLRIDGV